MTTQHFYIVDSYICANFHGKNGYLNAPQRDVALTLFTGITPFPSSGQLSTDRHILFTRT
jgi:hypothetical protein